MPAYIPGTSGANSSVASGAMAPALPAGVSDGNLMLLHTGVNSVSLGAPAITGWTLLTPNSLAKGDQCYGRIYQPGDASPTVQWDASHQAFARICYFSGDVYTDLSTIVAVRSDRGATTNSYILVNGLSVPAVDNCLIIRGGHTSKSALNNGQVFPDWDTNTGVLTKIGTDVNQNGNAIAATWWYWQQTNALGLSGDTDTLPVTDASSQNGQGWTIALLTLSTGLPVGEESLPDFTTRRSSQSAVQQYWSVPDTLTSLPPPDSPPFSEDFPNPRRRPMPLSALEQQTNTLPLGTDRVLQPALWDYEWDKPSLPLALRDDVYGTSPLLLFAANDFPPYQEFNWPVPPGARQWNRGFQSGFNMNLRGQDILTPDGPQKNMWDPPRGPKRPLENLSSLSSGLSLYYFIPPKPVGAISTDLPPQPARRLRQDFQLPMQATVLTFVSTLPPFTPCQDMPPRRSRRLAFYSYSYASSLLYRDLSQMPVGEQIFDLPRTRPRASLRALLYEILPYSQISPPVTPPGPPASIGQVAGPGGRIILMPKKVSETAIRPFDFISRLGSGELIQSAVTTASVYSGVDPSPALIINGSAAIFGTIVNQSLTAGRLGVIYELLCTIRTSKGQILAMSAFWTVEPDLP